jgi:bla regulator protein blaR1
MIFATEILPRWTETLGWTLLNSVWQGAIAVVLVIFFLRILPLRFSKVRYAIACAGLALLFLANVATFVILQTERKIESAEVSYFFTTTSATQATAEVENSRSWVMNSLTSALQLIDSNMSLILIAWSFGSLAFSLRLAGGWWFISKLRSGSTKLDNHWHEELQSLAKKLGINKVVQLAESTRVTTPMVLGFFKPLILIPSGMLSGLTTAEIETIFLHELAHIRRHDYIINIAQAFIETIFFFNPFVWIISNIVRREREYCCDDEVISIHGSSLTYAHALAQLEEWKLTKSTFALALAANKNQLLNRIKRIMEKTGQKYSVKDRFIPAALLIVGLVCASWLTVQKKQDSSSQENSTFSQDTTGKKKTSRTTIIRFDENGEAHEQIFEEFDGDEAMIAWPADFEVPPIPAMPDFPSMPAMPAFPSVVAVPSVPAFPGVHSFPTPPPGAWRISPGFNDTIPRAWLNHGTNWEDFSKEFEKKFSEEFSDFYKNHAKDFEKMMKEMELKFKQDFENGDLHGQLMEVQRLQELAHLDAFASEDHMRLTELQMAEIEELASLSELHAPMAADLVKMSVDLATLSGNINVLHGQAEVFEKELKEMLVKDGYLKKDEKISNISWSDDKIEVNGKKIKDSDARRYHEKHDQLFKERFHINRIE